MILSHNNHHRLQWRYFCVNVGIMQTSISFAIICWLRKKAVHATAQLRCPPSALTDFHQHDITNYDVCEGSKCCLSNGTANVCHYKTNNYTYIVLVNNKSCFFSLYLSFFYNFVYNSGIIDLWKVCRKGSKRHWFHNGTALNPHRVNRSVQLFSNSTVCSGENTSWWLLQKDSVCEYNLTQYE